MGPQTAPAVPGAPQVSFRSRGQVRMTDKLNPLGAELGRPVSEISFPVTAPCARNLESSK